MENIEEVTQSTLILSLKIKTRLEELVEEEENYFFKKYFDRLVYITSRIFCGYNYRDKKVKFNGTQISTKTLLKLVGSNYKDHIQFLYKNKIIRKTTKHQIEDHSGYYDIQNNWKEDYPVIIRHELTDEKLIKKLNESATHRCAMNRETSKVEKPAEQKQIYKFDDNYIIDFGMYKNRKFTFKDVYEINPSYINWLIANFKDTEKDLEMKKYLKNLLKELEL